MQPLPPKPYLGHGRRPVATRRTPDRQPVSVADLAQSLPPEAFSTITWRQGTNDALAGRFAALRVRHAGGVTAKQRLHAEQWLLIEWPQNKDEPRKYWLSTLPEATPLAELARVAHVRWRIERDYQNLKQDLGLAHYEGCGWRGFHHHASLAIAAYGFLVAQRLDRGGNHTDTRPNKAWAGGKTSLERRLPVVPENHVPRGASAGAAPQSELDHDTTAAACQRPAQRNGNVSVLRQGQAAATLVTQQD